MIPPSRLDVRESDPERLRLDNGLTVILRRHGAADVAAVQLWVRVGACHEAEPEAGLSHFIEHLLFKGTPSRGPGVIDRTISGLGGEMNAATAQDFTYYHLVLPARHTGTALDALGDAARDAAFDQEEVERERLVVLEEIRRADDDPSACLWRTLSRHHFAGHPYGRPVLGFAGSIAAVGRDAIVAYYRRRYVPNAATLVVVGNTDRAGTLEAIRKAFDDWEPRPVPGAEAGRAPAVDTVRRVHEVRPLQQTYVGMAWEGPVPPEADVHAVDVLVSILGRGRSSRLHQALRERLGVVSSVSASFYAQHEGGTITVTARTTPARRHEVEDAVLAEVTRLSRDLAAEDELVRAWTGIEAGHAFAHETAEGVAYAYGSAETMWTLDFELGYLDEIGKVTGERVLDAARRYLVPDRFTAVVLGPGDGAA